MGDPARRVAGAWLAGPDDELEAADGMLETEAIWGAEEPATSLGPEEAHPRTNTPMNDRNEALMIGTFRGADPTLRWG